MIRSGGAISIADPRILASFFSSGAAPTEHVRTDDFSGFYAARAEVLLDALKLLPGRKSPGIQNCSATISTVRLRTTTTDRRNGTPKRP